MIAFSVHESTASCRQLASRTSLALGKRQKRRLSPLCGPAVIVSPLTAGGSFHMKEMCAPCLKEHLLIHPYVTTQHTSVIIMQFIKKRVCVCVWGGTFNKCHANFILGESGIVICFFQSSVSLAGRDRRAAVAG